MPQLQFDTPPLGIILSGRERAEIRAGGFALDCLEISLTARDPSDPKRKFIGPGQLRQTDEGGLTFTLYDSSAEAKIEHVLPIGRQRGEWLTEDDFCNLQAIDWQGRRWSADWIWPDVSGRAGQPGTIVTGQVRQLTCLLTDQEIAASHVQFAARGKVDIMTSGGTEIITRRAGREGKSFARDIWIIEDEDERIDVLRSDIGLDVSWHAKAQKEVPRGLDSRLEEALWLLTLQPVEWFLLEERSIAGNARTVIRPRRDRSVVHRLTPPFESHHIEAAGDASDLFIRFLSKLRTYSEERYHPISTQLRRVIHASSRSIEDEALALGVAVESLIRTEYGHFAAASEHVINATDDLIKHIETWAGDSRIQERAIGALGAIKGANARQALEELVKAGIIANRHVQAWKRVRHPAAHGSERSADYPTQVADCDLVKELYLLVIADLLGYTGRFTQTTKMGHPLTTVHDIVAESV